MEKGKEKLENLLDSLQETLDKTSKVTLLLQQIASIQSDALAELESFVPPDYNAHLPDYMEWVQRTARVSRMACEEILKDLPKYE